LEKTCKLLSGSIEKPTNILVRKIIFMAKTLYRDVGTNDEADFTMYCNKIA
jgi:hypothetical protein